MLIHRLLAVITIPENSYLCKKGKNESIETTGHIDKPGLLRLDQKIDFNKKKQLKVIILINEEDEINESPWLSSFSSNPAFDFLKEEGENIYSATDGKPFKR